MVIAAFDDPVAAAPHPGEVVAVWVQLPVDVDEVRLGGREHLSLGRIPAFRIPSGRRFDLSEPRLSAWVEVFGRRILGPGDQRSARRVLLRRVEVAADDPRRRRRLRESVVQRLERSDLPQARADAGGGMEDVDVDRGWSRVPGRGLSQLLGESFPGRGGRKAVVGASARRAGLRSGGRPRAGRWST